MYCSCMMDFLEMLPEGADDRALSLLAQSGSVSFRRSLPPATLEKVLLGGGLPEQWTPHVATLLDEAPDDLLLRGIRIVARKSGVPEQEIWRTAQKIAEMTQSTNPRWRHEI